MDDINKEIVNTLQLAKSVLEKGRNVQNRLHRMIYGFMRCSDQNMTDLTIAQMEVIMMVRRNGELTITKLSEMLNVSPPSTSAMVDRLVEKKILTRIRSEDDRRKVVVSIQEETTQQIEKLEREMFEFFTKIVEKLGTETSQLWLSVLEKIDNALDEIVETD